MASIYRAGVQKQKNKINKLQFSVRYQKRKQRKIKENPNLIRLNWKRKNLNLTDCTLKKRFRDYFEK